MIDSDRINYILSGLPAQLISPARISRVCQVFGSAKPLDRFAPCLWHRAPTHGPPHTVVCFRWAPRSPLGFVSRARLCAPEGQQQICVTIALQVTVLQTLSGGS